MNKVGFSLITSSNFRHVVSGEHGSNGMKEAVDRVDGGYENNMLRTEENARNESRSGIKKRAPQFRIFRICTVPKRPTKLG